MIDVLHREHTEVATALTIRLQVVSAGSGRPLHGRSVRLWHCDHPVEVRISDENGWTEFDSLLPPTGPGRWPHLHFEIHGHTGRLTLPGDAYATGTLRRMELGRMELGRMELGRMELGRMELGRTDLAAAPADEPLMMASVTGDARRGLVATRMISTPGRG